MPNTAKKPGKPAIKSTPHKYRGMARPAVVFTVPETKEEYARIDALIKELLIASNYDENHPLAALTAALGELLIAHDEEHYPEDNIPAREMLAYLMEENGLTQRDLPEIASQGVLSEILSGKRKLNVRQIKALSERFHVGIELFID